jgi:lysophospholipase L1-like esterase
VAVTFTAASASGGVAPVQLSCTRESGSPFAVGATTVQCTATDAAAQTTSCIFTVTVTAAIPRLSRTKFLAFGDSFTAGEVSFPTSRRLSDGLPIFQMAIVPSAAYPTQLTSLLRGRYTAQAASIEVTNGGSPGEWSEDGSKRLPGLMSTLRPEAVLLLHGVNELAALGPPGVTRAIAAIDLMAKEIRGRGARAFIATLPPTRAPGTRLVPNELVTSLNALIRRAASGEGAVLVDVNAALAADLTRYIGVDGRHPTEAGYQRIAQLFFDAIRNDLEIR